MSPENKNEVLNNEMINSIMYVIEKKSCESGCKDIGTERVRTAKEKQKLRSSRYYQKHKKRIYQRQCESEKRKYEHKQWANPCPACGELRIFKTRKGYSNSIKYNSTCNDCKICNKLEFNDITGKKFNKWTVMRRAKRTKDGKSGWLCRCDCGTERVITSYALKTNRTRGCKCLGRKRPFEWLYLKIRRTSIRASKKCYLTYEEFLAFTRITQCSYCGSQIKWIPHSTRGEPTGYCLDRMDNNLGYTKNNCVVCCADCNMIKSNRFTYEEMCKLGPVVADIKRKRRNGAIKC